MSSIAASSGTEAPAEEFRWGWPVVLACFFTATFAWGFGLRPSASLGHTWQLYAWSLFRALGWAFTTVTAIATTLSYWFERRRGFALKLALNGAATGGSQSHRYWRASLITSAW